MPDTFPEPNSAQRSMESLRETTIPTPGRPSSFSHGSLEHGYGPRVEIVGDAWTATALSKLSSPEVSHTELVGLVKVVTARLASVAFAHLPSAPAATVTRMAEKHGAELGTWRGTALDPSAGIVVIDVIRGGMIPSQVVFELLTLVLPIESLRLDHLNMERVAGPNGGVERVDLSGSKVGGSIEGATLILPDPMGATGSTMVRALQHLIEKFGRPAKILMLPLIATPEFLRAVLDFDESVHVVAGRVDRGMSPADVQQTPFGARWAEESGLDDDAYIVPGAGGVGELLNNSY